MGIYLNRLLTNQCVLICRCSSVCVPWWLLLRPVFLGVVAAVDMEEAAVVMEVAVVALAGNPVEVVVDGPVVAAAEAV